MKSYRKYKPSGIDWIEYIPEHWKKSKLKYITNVNMGQSPSSEFYNSDKIGIPFLQGNADFGELNPIPSVWTSEASKLAQKDDILISVRAPIGAVNIADQEYAIGRGLCSLNTVNNDSKYLYYSMLVLKDMLNSLGTGSTFTAISAEEVRNILTVYPTINEQIKIRTYLDNKIFLIDKLIIQKHRLIKLLEEERAAVINEAVTKGLNPDVKMKDSGIPWIGDIPEHWETKRLKYIATKIGDGIHATPNYVNSSEKYFVNGNNLIQDRITITDATRCIDESEYEKLKVPIKKGSILISINGTIGNLAYYNNEKVVFGKSVAYIELKDELHNKMAYFIFQASYVTDIFEESLSGTTIKNLSLYTLRNTKMLIPPIKEQLEIIEFIENKLQELNNTKSRINKEIKLLEEYRTALISETVTGQIDIGNFTKEKLNEEVY
jgi:type I restriction enzyme S subunit